VDSLTDLLCQAWLPFLRAITEPDWIEATQAIVAVVGTWLLAFGLKKLRGLDTMIPFPKSIRFWLGLILISLAAVPALARFVINRCPL
jgi:hypothetical protein